MVPLLSVARTLKPAEHSRFYGFRRVRGFREMPFLVPILLTAFEFQRKEGHQ